MKQTLIAVRDNATVNVGKQVFVGTAYDYKITSPDTPLVSHRSVLHPVMVRPVDNNKYRPHSGGGMKATTLN